MRWFYAEGGRQMGPVEESELDRLITAGVVRDDTLVWHEGMAGWQPHAAIRGSTAPPISGVPPISTTPPISTAPPVSAAPTIPVARPFATFRYAGFWIRVLARIIDGMILGLAGLIIRLPLVIMLGIGMGRGNIFSMTPGFAAVTGLSFLLNLVIGVVYEVYFVSTRGATPGKMALGLKIIRADGSAVDAGLALGRYVAYIISGLLLCIGYIMVAFDSQKRALHDRICETRVIYVR
jgi:uncharacterized RDD family membrane protein YckC